MAADCVTRVCALAIATAACIGLPSALIYAIVRIAAARRYGATFALGLVLVFWVTVSAAYYPRVCADTVPWPRFLRRACARLSRGHGGEAPVLVPQRSYIDVLPRLRPQAPAPAPAPASGPGARVRDDDGSAPSPYPGPLEHQRVPLAERYGDRGGGGMMEGVAVAPSCSSRGSASCAAPAPTSDSGAAQASAEPSLLVPQRTSFATVDAFPPRPRPQAPAPAAARSRGGARVRAGNVSSPSPYPFDHQRVPLAQRYGDLRVVMMPVFPWETQTVIDVPPPLPPGYPLYEHHRDVPLAQSHGGDRDGASRTTMAALAREPPAARGKSRAGAGDDNGVPRPPCDDQGDGEPSKYCVICMTNVDKEETAKWLPLCLHVFHRQCIDQWLQGHSTCPICRCNDAFLTAECVLTAGEGRVF